MKRLVIGGAGFIGSNMAAYLLGKDEEVTVFDNLSRGGSEKNLEWLRQKSPNLRFVNGDIRTDIDLLNKEVSGAEVVYNFAAQVAVTTSVNNPREDFEINTLGAFNVLEAARLSSKPPVLFYSSTNKVYGGMEDTGVTEKNNRYGYRDLPNGVSEKQPLDFHSPYGCSKGAADQYFRDYSRIYSLKTVVFRQSCIYGERQFGIEDQGWLAWFTIASIQDKPITIYGDGKQVRDVLYVKDLIMAYEKALERIDVTAGQVYNIGGGPSFSVSLKESLNILEEAMQKKIELSFKDWRPGDQKVFISDITKARTDLGWEPAVDPEHGIAMLVDWVKKNKDLFLF